MEKNDEEIFLDKIWKDSNFNLNSKSSLTKEIIEKNKIRKLNEQGKMIAYCKYCSCELYISTTYNGKFPLCKAHRDPNDRIVNI